nr:integrase, catalytic region, zinc finger, CCHC-type, peptidase aspartic, catalytic [Tanacetum cinerariifolium]
MLDRTDFASWQQRIRLYCRGKENGVNILKSINEGMHKIRTFRETLAESTEGTPQFVDPLALLSNVSNPQHDSPSSLASSSTQVPPPLAESSSPVEDLIENLTNTLALLTQSYRTFLPQTNNQLRTSSNARNQATAQENRVALDAEQLLFLAGGQDNVFDDDVDKQPVQDLALNVDNVFQANDCDAFDSDMDEAPTAQTMFMANLSSVDPVTDEARPSYDSDILSEYVRDNEVSVVHSGASSVPTDAFMMIYNDMCESHDPSISNTSRNTVVKNSLTAELATYKEHIELVVIGYKNPLCLTRTKQVQLALYNGHEIIKDNHTPAIVHNSEDTLEIAEINRKKMNDKMNDPKCVTRKTKACYLQEVIPFFKTLKDSFEGIQKALTKEVKEMKDVFEELEAEVAQYAVDTKRDAIELKNLLIANVNLIAACLSQEVFSVATNSELNVARFTKMHVANTTVEVRCLALEAELANLRKDNVIRQLKKKLSQLQETRSDTDRTPKVQTTDTQITKLTKLTSHVTHLQAQNDLFMDENDKIKQHYKELYESIKITRAKHIEQVTKLTTENVNLKTSVTKDKVKLQVLTRAKHAIDVEPIIPCLRNNRDAHLDYLRHLKESVETIRDIVEEAKVVRPLDRSIVSAYRYTKHSHELLEYAIGVNRCPKASGSQPKSNLKPNRISPAKGVNKLPVEDQPRAKKSHVRTTNRVNSSSHLKRTKPKQVRQVWKPTGKILTTIGHQWRPTGWILNLGKQCPLTRFTPPKVVSAKQSKKRTSCSKHMTGDRSRLMNFMKKFTRTVRFGNDHFGAIMGYGHYVIGNSVISRMVLNF